MLAASLAGPLALSFDKKVAFYKKWTYLFKALLLPALLYIVWDIYFTSKEVWSFNKQYITGIKLFNLPIEEVLFFFVVPYCCVFIYECVRCYFPALKSNKTADRLLISIGVVLGITGLIFFNRMYTSWTFILTGFFIALLYSAYKFFPGFNATAFLAAYVIMLIPFLIVNGFLTAIPVVLYNQDENLHIRIFTIPFEDVFYGMLLILMTIAPYEKLRQKKV
ncbi:MAG: lycopene cyclase domain-containing protein [Bacteroidetes bacterium]|nr:lycopene cyclase domain-containing protein [Bacteroidota bacterium]